MSGNDQELTGQAGGVGEASPAPSTTGGGEQATGAGGAVAGGEPTADGAAGPAIAEGQQVPAPGAEPSKPVDLTQMAEFRRWQAARDRREAQLQQQLEQGQSQMQEMQRRLETLQLADADPEQVASYYQQRLAELQEQQAQQAAVSQQRQKFLGAAQELLDELGLAYDTPGLEWSDEPSAEGLARLAASAAKLKALQAQGVARESQAVADQAAQAAKVEALTQAGVTKVSTATGAASPSGQNPIADITDPDTLLRMGLKGGGS